MSFALSLRGLLLDLGGLNLHNIMLDKEHLACIGQTQGWCEVAR